MRNASNGEVCLMPKFELALCYSTREEGVGGGDDDVGEAVKNGDEAGEGCRQFVTTTRVSIGANG